MPVAVYRQIRKLCSPQQLISGPDSCIYLYPLAMVHVQLKEKLISGISLLASSLKHGKTILSGKTYHYKNHDRDHRERQNNIPYVITISVSANLLFRQGAIGEPLDLLTWWCWR